MNLSILQLILLGTGEILFEVDLPVSLSSSSQTGFRIRLHNIPPSLGSIKQDGNVFQRQRTILALGLNDGVVQPDEFKAQPSCIDDLVFPTEFRESDGVDILIEHEREVDTFRRDKQSFGSDGKWQNLDSIRSQEWGHDDVVKGVVKEEKTDDRPTCGCVWVIGIRLGVSGGRNGDTDIDNTHTTSTGEPQRSSASPVHDKSSTIGREDVPELQDTVDQVLGALRGDTDTSESQVEVV